MEIYIQKDALEKYAAHVADVVCHRYFAEGKAAISGLDIRSFFPVEQVNYFIFKNLFSEWYKETENWKKSPYFDYQSAEVTEAMAQLQRVLSNHIKVEKTTFKTLVASAVAETLWLCYAPFHYFKENFLNANGGKISLSDLQTKVKYVKINNTFFKAFLEKLETYKIPNFVVDDVMGHYQEAYAKHMGNLENPDTYLAYFNQISAIPTEQIFPTKKNVNEPVAPKPAAALPEPELVTTKTALQPKKSIKLGLNQRIMFVKNLFDGDVEKLDITIARLETSGSWDNAKYILDFFKWNKEDEVVQEFYDLVQAKFK